MGQRMDGETYALGAAEIKAIENALKNEYFRLKNAGGNQYGPLSLKQLWALKSLIGFGRVTLSRRTMLKEVFSQYIDNLSQLPQ